MWFLIQITSNLIAGKKSMNDAKKKKIDIDKIKVFMYKGFIIAGIAIIIIGFLLGAFNVKYQYRIIITAIITTISVIYIKIYFKKKI